MLRLARLLVLLAAPYHAVWAENGEPPAEGECQKQVAGDETRKPTDEERQAAEQFFAEINERFSAMQEKITKLERELQVTKQKLAAKEKAEGPLRAKIEEERASARRRIEQAEAATRLKMFQLLAANTAQTLAAIAPTIQRLSEQSAAAPDNDTLRSQLEGMEMIRDGILRELLASDERIRLIPAEVGSPFSAQLHHALAVIANTGQETGSIAQVQAPGFVLTDVPPGHPDEFVTASGVTEAGEAGTAMLLVPAQVLVAQ